MFESFIALFITHLPSCLYINPDIPYIGNFSRREILAKMTLDRCVKFSLSPIFVFDGLSMKTYRRVYFSLCLFLVISGRSRTQRKLNPHEKFPIYGIDCFLPTCTLHMINVTCCMNLLHKKFKRIQKLLFVFFSKLYPYLKYCSKEVYNSNGVHV